MLRESDYPLPKEFEKAYRDSDIIVFETELDRLSSPEIQEMTIRKGSYNDELSLDRVISPQTYDFLREYCEALGIPIISLNRLKPPMVVLTLFGFELQKQGINQSGVENYFHHKAKAEGKKIEWLESVEEQIEFVMSMGKGNEDDFIVHSIKDMKNTGQILDKLIAAWKQGNEDKLYNLVVAQIKKDYPYLYTTLLIERNREWLPKIERYLKTPEKEFVLVGVGHLVGKNGILENLRQRGYKITKSEEN